MKFNNSVAYSFGSSKKRKLDIKNQFLIRVISLLVQETIVRSFRL